MTHATATAHPNIALVKYWGKADAAQNLPAAGSMSMTLDIFPTETTVALAPGTGSDRVFMNGRERDGVVRDRVVRFLDHVRTVAGSDVAAEVTTHNTVPSAAGLASSAAGFAALAAAASAVYGLPQDPQSLSRLARRGSGSAARSIVSRFALWHAGSDTDSFAEPIDAPDMAMIIATVNEAEKSISSRDAMTATARTSPFYPAWVTSTAHTVNEAIAACHADDFVRLGQLTESHALRMHAVIQAAEPPIRYLTPTSWALFDAAAQLRSEGISAWATADAGPNVCVICPPSSADEVAERLRSLAPTVISRPGPGAQLREHAA